MAFPSNPSNNQQATVNGVIYTYNNTIPAWSVTTNAGANVSANNIAAVAAITAATVSASGNINANYFFGNGSQLTGVSSTTTSVGNNSISVNNTNITANANIAVGQNGFSVGPVSTASGYQVIVASGQRWVII